jgi:hypothetical protein
MHGTTPPPDVSDKVVAPQARRTVSRGRGKM